MKSYLLIQNLLWGWEGVKLIVKLHT